MGLLASLISRPVQTDGNIRLTPTIRKWREFAQLS
uniref:Uncharacterized protein n=1 Tax=Anguilla anguilla TaxID=7936 RepID=A0A0E9VSA4_ANGAN